MFPGFPNADEVRSGSLTATGTLVTIPAGKWYTANVALHGAISVAGNCNPTVSISGLDASDPDGTILHRLNITGLALSALVDSSTMEILVKAGGNDVNLVFTQGATGTSSVTINGYLYG